MKDINDYKLKIIGYIALVYYRFISYITNKNTSDYQNSGVFLFL